MLLGGTGLRAAQLEIESPAFAFDQQAGVYRYEGARVRIGTFRIEADEVTVDTEAGLLLAEGRVRFQDEHLLGSAERLELHPESGLATAYRAEVLDTATNFHLRAETLVRVEPGRYEATSCRLTNCSPTDPAWSLESAKLTYRVNDFADTRNTTLWLGRVPVLWSPAFAWPTVRERRSGFLAPGLSDRRSSLDRFETGTRLRVPYFLALDVDHDLTLTPETHTERGTGLGAEYNYAFRTDQRGQLILWGIDETRSRDLEDENRIGGANLETADRTPQRFWGTWGHNQGLGADTRAVANAARASDGQVLREYEGVAEYRPYLDYQASLTHQARWGHSALTAEHASEYTQESIFANGSGFADGDTRPMLLPRASWHGGWQVSPRVPLGMELNTAVTRFVTESGVSGRGELAEPALTLPLRLGGSVEFRPTLARRMVRYEELEVDSAALTQTPADRPAWLTEADTLGREESFGQTEWHLELRAPLGRVYQPPSGQWTAVKHRLTPRLIYRELEDVEQPLAGLLYRPEPALKLLTFRLDNALIGRRGSEESSTTRQFAHVNLIQRYNLLLEDAAYEPAGPALPSPGETEPGEPLLPAILEAGIDGSGYGLESLLRYHHQLGRLVEYRLGLTGHASPRGRFRIRYTENEFAYRTPENKLTGAGSNLSMNGDLIADDTLSFGLGGTVDLRNTDLPLDRRLTSAGLAVDYHPDCWGLRVDYLEQVGVTREFDSSLGENTDVYYIDRQILVTFNLGGVVTTQRGFTIESGQP